ncbi:hypothetical protein RFI_08040 [Reticulomyxa filosa]|uniref:Uncharacterized protein n=1 Tax=Reticulomyxa filosa TaxID=46433 RepID=X6NSV0_RETFI|nr:hypothetical protein RFI_08040 [Reticulomyxa filosa]|eukprot:ETO29086.1 hypothetical protein RFI_08040 [Reticulomyxa filosa]
MARLIQLKTNTKFIKLNMNVKRQDYNRGREEEEEEEEEEEKEEKRKHKKKETMMIAKKKKTKMREYGGCIRIEGRMEDVEKAKET